MPLDDIRGIINNKQFIPTLRAVESVWRILGRR